MLATAVGWSALLGGMWLLLVDTASSVEAACGAAAALTGALVTRLVFASGIAAMRHPGGLSIALARQIARVPADMWLLVVALVRTLAGRRPRGRFHEVAIELPLDAHGNGRRASIELIGSLSPNTIVLGVDERRVIVHQLSARQSERESVVRIGT